MIAFLLQRPIAIFVSCCAVLALGLLAMQSLPISLLPNVAAPTLQVHIRYPQASLTEVERLVTSPLRRQLVQVSQLIDLESESQDGQAMIRMQFAFGSNMDLLFLEANEKIDQLMGSLPREVERPQVIRANASDLPIFLLHVRLADAAADERKFLELSEFTNSVLRRRLEQLAEVAMVDITGRQFPEIQIRPDLDRMQSLGIQHSDLQAVLQQANLPLGNLRVREGQYEYQLQVTNRLKSPQDIAQLPLKIGERILLLEEIATVELLAQTAQGSYLSDGQAAIGMAIIKQADVRMADLSQSVEAVLMEFETAYPDLRFSLSQDQSQLLEVAIRSLGQALLLGAILAFVVMWLFQRDWRSAGLIGLSIPLSLLGCMIGFFLLDISINVISLSGLILGVGLMIDNAIIVLDNMTQYRQRGLSSFEASVQGTQEVIRPLLSSALTTSAVFLPLILLSGIAGALFADQAIAITIGLGVSWVVSITVLPTVYHFLYRSRSTGDSLTSVVLKPRHQWYQKSVEWVLKHPGWAGGGFLILAGLGIGGMLQLPLQQFPDIPQSAIRLEIDWGESIHPAENQARVQVLLNQLHSSLSHSASEIGSQQFVLQQDVNLTPSQARLYLESSNPAQVQVLQATIRDWIQTQYPNSRFSFSAPPSLFEQLFVSDEPLLVAEISRPDPQAWISLSDGQALIQRINDQLGTQLPSLPSQTTILIEFLPEQLLLYQLEPQQLHDHLKRIAQTYWLDDIAIGQQLIPIRLSGPPTDVRQLLQTSQLINSEGRAIPLSSLVHISSQDALVSLFANPAGPYLPIAFSELPASPSVFQQQLRQIIQDAGFQVHFSGQLFEDQSLVQEFAYLLLLALLLLYLILAAQFESLLLPLVVLLEVPLDLAGVWLLLWMGGTSLNLMSLIGIVVMSGIIINDSILKIDTIHRLRLQGVPLQTAIHQGGQRRLKPIVMTSLTTVLAALPLLFGGDLGSSLQSPLALALIGGMLVGTLISLYFIPWAYYLMYRGKDN
ncbi:MAG: efflux RND transporter permease subunit [Bacteroidota bacterium]